MNHADVLIVGAGIVGLAHALAAAKRGLSVVVFERNLQAVGASIRNFGMIWPIGQPAGTLYDRALQAREIWLEVAPAAKIAIDPCGSLLLAYRQDELDVLEEFMATQTNATRLLTTDEVAEKSSAAITDKLKAGLWSPTEAIVDPREAIAKLPSYLAETYGVKFEFGTIVHEVNYPTLIAGGRQWRGDRVLICSGADFETLYPEIYADSGITKVKLQMLRTVPQTNWKLGAALCTGLTLTHYGAFAHCRSLDVLKQRIELETPHLLRWGIHVLVSQNASGELIIGDSHEYGLTPAPFNRTDINQYILNYLKTFVAAPSFEIAATWNGVYAKLSGQTEWITHPEAGVTIVNALGGAGMTLSFGLAETVMAAE